MKKLAAIFIAISLAASWFFRIGLSVVNAPQSNTDYFIAMQHGVHSYAFDKVAIQVCKLRVGSLWLSSEWTTLWQTYAPHWSSMYLMFGTYQSVGLLMTLFLCIVFLKEPIFPMFAIFSGLIYNGLVTVWSWDAYGQNTCPWDMPSLFAWTLAFLLWFTGRCRWMVVVIILGTVFKESVALSAILLFFTGLKRIEQVKLFAVTFLGCIAVRLLITRLLFGVWHVVEIDSKTEWVSWLSPFFQWNFMSWHPNSFLFASGGMMIGCLLLWPKNQKEWGIYTLLILFYCLDSIAPIISCNQYEVRQFIDVLAVSAIYLQLKLTSSL